MKRFSLLLAISVCSLGYVYAANTINLRADKVITSSITTTAPRLDITTDTYTTGYSSATTFYGDGANLTGISAANTQNEMRYTIVIATFAGTGIDLVTNGTNDEVEFEAANALVSAGDTVLVLPGTYNFNSECDITVAGVSWIGYGATISVGSGLTNYKGTFKFSSTADNCTIEGFKIDGNLVTCVGIAAFSGVTYLTIRNMSFLDVGNGTDGHTINLDSGSNFAVVENCTFVNCEGQYGIRADTAFSSFRNLNFQGCKIAIYVGSGGAANTFSNVIMSDIQGTIGVQVVGPRNVFTVFDLTGAFSGSAGLVEISGDFNVFSNSMLYNSRGLDGILLTSTAQSNLISNVIIGEILTLSGITDAGDNNTIMGCTFLDTIVRYPIEIDSTANSSKIMGCDATDVDGSIANTVLDGGTNTTIFEYTPSMPSQLQQETTFYSNLTVNGTFYSQHSYAELYTFDNTLFSTTTANVSDFKVIEAYNWFSDEMNGFDVTDSSMTYTGKGGAGKIFMVVCAISAYVDTINSETHWRLFLNGVQHDPIHIERFMASNNDVGAMVLSGLITLSEGDIMQVRVSSDKAIEIVTQHMNFSIIQIN